MVCYFPNGRSQFLLTTCQINAICLMNSVLPQDSFQCFLLWKVRWILTIRTTPINLCLINWHAHTSFKMNKEELISNCFYVHFQFTFIWKQQLSVNGVCGDGVINVYQLLVFKIYVFYDLIQSFQGNSVSPGC